MNPVPGRIRAGYVHFTDEGKLRSVSLLSTASTKEEIDVLLHGLRPRLGEPSVVDQKTRAFDKPMRQTAWVNQGCDSVVFVNVERSLKGAMFGRMVEVGLVPAVSFGSPVMAESGRVVFAGYSVEPPREEGWRGAPEGTEGGDVRTRRTSRAWSRWKLPMPTHPDFPFVLASRLATSAARTSVICPYDEKVIATTWLAGAAELERQPKPP